MTLRFCSAVLATLAVAATGLSLPSAFWGVGKAAHQVSQRKSVQDALDQIFNQPGFGYVISPDVKGMVYADFPADASSEDKLRKVLRQVNATFRGAKQAVVIVPLHEAPLTLEPNSKPLHLEFDSLDVTKALPLLFDYVNSRYTVDPKVSGVVTVSLRNVTFEQALQNTLKQVNATWRETGGAYEIVLKTPPETFASYEPSHAPVDVRVALHRLLGKAGVVWSISSDVRGLVVPPAGNIAFEPALHQVLKQVNARYRVEGGIYEIVSSTPPEAQRSGVSQDDSVSVTLDNRFVFVFKGGVIFKLNKSDLKTVQRESFSSVPPLAPDLRVDVQEAKTDIREALRRVFKLAGISYSIDPEVQGTVNLNMSNVPLEDAVNALAAQVNARLEVQGGIAMIRARRVRFGGGPQDLSHSPTPTVVAQDDKFLFVLKGDVISKVTKSDLKTVSQRRLGG